MQLQLAQERGHAGWELCGLPQVPLLAPYDFQLGVLLQTLAPALTSVVESQAVSSFWGRQSWGCEDSPAHWGLVPAQSLWTASCTRHSAQVLTTWGGGVGGH